MLSVPVLTLASASARHLVPGDTVGEQDMFRGVGGIHSNMHNNSYNKLIEMPWGDVLYRNLGIRSYGGSVIIIHIKIKNITPLIPILYRAAREPRVTPPRP